MPIPRIWDFRTDPRAFIQEPIPKGNGELMRGSTEQCYEVLSEVESLDLFAALFALLPHVRTLARVSLLPAFPRCALALGFDGFPYRHQPASDAYVSNWPPVA